MTAVPQPPAEQRGDVAAVLATHYWAGHGLTYGSPDTCSCGEQTFPARGDEDVMERRARAFAAHQAAMLAAALTDGTPR